ncbi:hypothetical protein D3C78_1377440 [compost metagenome]
MPCNEVYSTFSNIRSVIGNAFNITTNQRKKHGLVQGFRMLYHKGIEITDHLTVQMIHFIVILSHFICQIRVFIEIGLQGFFNH